MKNNKGFTLIELLVVVAIIGILAAVGTVAYTGYTSAAKKNAAKTMHSQAVKYLTAEVQKCSINTGGTALGGDIDCDATTGDSQPTAANYLKHIIENSTDKTPHDPSTKAYTDGTGTDQGLLYFNDTAANTTTGEPGYIDIKMRTATTGGDDLTAKVVIE